MTVVLLLCALSTLNPWQAFLPDHTRVTVYSVSDDPKKRAWLPNGSPAKLIEDIPTMDFLSAKPKRGQLAVYFGIAVPSIPFEPSARNGREMYQPQVSQDPKATNKFYPLAIGSKIYLGRRDYEVPKHDSMNLRVGFATGKWKVAQKIRYRGGKALSGRGFSGDLEQVSLAKGASKTEGFPIRVPSSALSEDYRVRAIDKHGNPVIEGGEFWVKGRRWAWFPKDIKEIQLQVRPFDYVTFHNVRTKPADAK